MRVLVTGGVGFIGSHIVEALEDSGHEPVVLDNAIDTGDVRHPEDVRRALHGIDAVCHQAAKVGLDRSFADAPDYVANNDLGTAVLLAAMAEAGVDRLVLASSMVVYGEGRYECERHGWIRPGPRREDDLIAGRFDSRCDECGRPLVSGLVGEDAPLDPRNVYAATKLMQEHLAASWARVTGGQVAALRYHNVYGPRMPRDTPYAGVAALFRSALLNGEAPLVFEDGGQRRDFTHVRDIASANVAALEWAADSRVGDRRVGDSRVGAGVGFRAFNVGSGTPRTVGEMAQELSSAMRGPKPVVTGGYRLGDVRHITASSERLRTELGWKPAVGFEAGMAEFAAEREEATV